MKKLFIVVAILALMAGTAYAAALDDGLTRDVWAKTTARSVTSDGTVLFRVWCDASVADQAHPGVGVSTTTGVIYLYSDYTANTLATTFTTSAAAYDTVGEIVASINSVTGWHAEGGPDAYDSVSLSGTLLPSNIAAVGNTEATAGSVYEAASTTQYLRCGVDPEPNKIARLKQFTHKVAGTGYAQVRIYKGDTKVWEKVIRADSYNTATYNGASPDTVIFSDDGSRGLCSDVNKPLVVEVYRQTTFGDTSHKTTDCNISILYDKF